jgi:hypothetical protein
MNLRKIGLLLIDLACLGWKVINTEGDHLSAHSPEGGMPAIEDRGSVAPH